MNQAEIARILGHPQSWVAKIESGERQLLFLEFLDICQALGVEPHEAIKNFP